MSILKAGIIGYGYMGEIRRTLVDRNPRLKLAGICDTSESVRQKIEGCPVFDSYERLLGQDIDVVFVCTPNRFSPEICVSSLSLGKHVFCEKPPGRHADDIRAILRAETGQVKLMFGFNHRFHPGIQKAKVLVESGRFGRILGMRGVYGKSGGIHFSQSWRNDRTVSGGGILLDQGIHMLDLFRYFCGDFDFVKCFIDHSFWKFDVEDNAYVLLQNKNGQTASLHSSSTFWKHTFRLDVLLEDGYLVVDGLLSKTGSYGRQKIVVGRRQFEDEAGALGNPAEEVTYFDKDLSWDLEVEEFIRCIDTDSPVRLSSSEDALRVMEIIEKAYADSQIEALAGFR